MMFKKRIFVMSALFILVLTTLFNLNSNFGAALAANFSDNFNDGNDNGWRGDLGGGKR